LRSVILIAVIVVGIVVLGFGCEMGHKLSDCRIDVTVIDADTQVPVDSVRVYDTYVDYFGVSHSRHLRGLTDENGKFSTVTGCGAFDIIDVEKEGYQPAKQQLYGGGEVLFALEIATP